MARLILFLLCAVVASNLFRELDDPDLWWHIVFGRWILAHKTVPFIDYWTEFGAGRPWIAYSWSNEVLFAVIEKVAGFTGLVGLFLGLLWALCFVHSFVCEKLAKDKAVGPFFAILGVAGGVFHYSLRPQLVTLVVLSLLIGVMQSITEKGISGTRLFLVALFFCVWANTHLSLVLALGVVILWGIEKRSVLDSVIISLTGIAGSLCTPYVGAEWGILFAKKAHPFIFSFIVEFKPATIYDFAFGFFLLFTSVLVVFLSSARKIEDKGALLLCILFSIGGLAVTKFLPFALLVVSAYCSLVWQDSQAKSTKLGEGISLLFLQGKKLIGPGLAVLLFALVVVQAKPIFNKKVSRNIVAVDTLNYVQKAHLPAPFLNNFGMGGYVLYRLANAEGEVSSRVNIDGRTNVTPEDIIMADYGSLRGDEVWREYIDYLKPQTVLVREGFPLGTILSATGEWCQLSPEGSKEGNFRVASIYIRKEFFQTRQDLLSRNCSL